MSFVFIEEAIPFMRGENYEPKDFPVEALLYEIFARKKKIYVPNNCNCPEYTPRESDRGEGDYTMKIIRRFENAFNDETVRARIKAHGIVITGKSFVLDDAEKDSK